MKKGHSARYCRLRKSRVPKGIFKWIPRCIGNTKINQTLKVPNSLRDQTLRFDKVMFCRFLISFERFNKD